MFTIYSISPIKYNNNEGEGLPVTQQGIEDRPAERAITVTVPRPSLQSIISRVWLGNEKTSYDVRPLVEDLKDNQWLGASLTREPYTGKVAVCGHRWSNTFYADAILPNGVCYQLDAALNYMTVEKIRPCLTETQIKADVNGKGIPWHGWCQAGFSAEYSIDGNTLILGAVGSLAWRGSVISVTESNYGAEVNVADVSSWYPANEEDESYIGYSVSSGYFVRSDLVHGVTGAPRAYQKGKVFIYDLQTFSVHAEFFGEKMNTYFGAAVKGIDLNKDGMTDLLVGAPLYSKVLDEGRVYIYMNKGMGILRQLDVKLSGSDALNARFGSVIENIGDINQDRYDDVAIGAPYEDENRGAVYIYQTSYSGIRTQYSQRISGRQVDPFVKSFGSSISGKVDVDGNIYPDIAIGAFLQNRVFVLRTRPIVHMESTMTITPNPINKNNSNCLVAGKTAVCLNLQACLRYTGIAVPPSLSLNYTLTVEKNKVLQNRPARVVFLSTTRTSVSSTERLEVGQQHCYKYQFQVKNEVTDFLSPIPFHFTYDLIVPEPPMINCLGGPCPILDMLGSRDEYQQVRFAHNCGNDQVCKTDLRLQGDIQIPGGSSYLPLGLQPHIYASIRVVNMGEEAHQAKVIIAFPQNVVFIKSENAKTPILALCEPEVKPNSTLTTVICDIGNPLPAKVEAAFKLKLDVSAVTGDQQGFSVAMLANSSSFETNITRRDNAVTRYVRVRVEADVTVKGVAHPEQVEFGLDATDVDSILEDSLDHVLNVSLERQKNNLFMAPLADEEKTIGPSFTHVYHARNMGPSKIPYPSTVNITIPWRTKEGDWLIYISRVEVEGIGECDYDSVFKAQHHQIREQYQNVTTAFQELNTNGDSIFTTTSKIKSQRINCQTAECVTLTCNVDVMPIDAYLIVRIYARIWEHSFITLNLGLAEILTTAEISVNDPLNQHIEPVNQKPNKAIVSTTVYTEEAVSGDAKVPFWIIVSSILVGIISLILIVFILRKVGFFHRKHKEELDQLIEDDKCEMEGLTSRQAIEEIWSNGFHESDVFS
ncbi:integrin alpha-9-like isoform X2 [Anneissia japonica]|uniref:integrin alpha-9-like isoform X2 n=1 Tax=Anneissia japonica TaxID=1529436 RepID=UPI001425AE3D|nr:integrin alpha-9-like isoform X2 [Anneissia japonica]